MIDKEVAQVQSVSFRSDGGAALRRMMEGQMNIRSKGENKGRKVSLRGKKNKTGRGRKQEVNFLLERK